MRTRVKICGITRLEDAINAVEAGADALGFVFYAPSPRAVTIAQVAPILEQLPPFVSKVALFVNASADEVFNTIQQLSIDCLQFHGDESATFCAQFNLPYYKAIRVQPSTNLIQCEVEFASARAFLLDTYSDKLVGGTGQVFNWDLIPADMRKPIILAGGLDETNVAQAIAQVKPYAVDVSGGVELSKGIKSKDKMRALMQQVYQPIR